jgi:hypothetical protein
MRVIAERLVEGRAIAKCSLDIDGLVRRSTGIDVRLLRAKKRLRRVRIGTQNRLAADDNELVFTKLSEQLQQ